MSARDALISGTLHKMILPFEILEFEPSVLDIRINGTISRKQTDIEVQFVASGSVSSVVWPEPVRDANRTGELWLSTCFEMFLMPLYGLNYWEFNFSPSGQWNVFAFDDYRAGFRQEERIKAIHLETQIEDNKVETRSHFSLKFLPEKPVLVGLSAVIEDKKNQIHYFALRHILDKPDFHHPKSFTVTI